jgi:hypothetical protein
VVGTCRQIYHQGLPNWVPPTQKFHPRIKALFRQTLGADSARELKEQMLAASLPA